MIYLLKMMTFYCYVSFNNVLLVKIEGPVTGIPSISIYHQLAAVKGVKQPPLLINQPMGKGHLWLVYQKVHHSHRIQLLLFWPWMCLTHPHSEALARFHLKINSLHKYIWWFPKS